MCGAPWPGKGWSLRLRFWIALAAKPT